MMLLLLLIVLSLALPVFPIWRILKRMGFNPALSLLYFVPIAGLIGLWRLAGSHWPNAPAAAEHF